MLEEFVIRLSNINSFSHNLKGIEAVAALLEKEIMRLKPDHFERISLKNGPALFATKRQRAKKQIYLGGHFDTVHQAHWDCVKKGDRLYGPGVLDMKGGLAILLNSLKEFEKSEESQKLGWRLFLNPDEELGSPFSAPLIAKKARGCNAALLFEPALPNHHLVCQRRGSVNFLCKTKGKAAHVGRNLEMGECAITKLAHFIVGVEKLNRQTIAACVGTVTGGHAANVVADQASCSLNLRFDKEFPEKALKKLASSYEVELQQLSFRPPKPFDKKTKELFLSLKRCAEKLGFPLDWEKTGGVCDGNETHHAKVPTIDTLGGEGDGIHTREEFLIIPSLKKKSAITTAFLQQLATGEYHAPCR